MLAALVFLAPRLNGDWHLRPAKEVRAPWPHYQLGHWSVAKGHFEAAIEAEPDLAEPHYNLALALHKLGSHTEATEHVMLAAQLAPSYRAITESSLYQRHVDWPQASGDGYLSCCGFTSERVPGD